MIPKYQHNCAWAVVVKLHEIEEIASHDEHNWDSKNQERNSDFRQQNMKLLVFALNRKLFRPFVSHTCIDNVGVDQAVGESNEEQLEISNQKGEELQKYHHS